MSTNLKTENLKQLIKERGTRSQHLAYALLRNRDPAQCESPFTRTGLDCYGVMYLVERYLDPSTEDVEGTLKQIRSKLKAWDEHITSNRRYIQIHGVRGLHRKQVAA